MRNWISIRSTGMSRSAIDQLMVLLRHSLPISCDNRTRHGHYLGITFNCNTPINVEALSRHFQTDWPLWRQSSSDIEINVIFACYFLVLRVTQSVVMVWLVPFLQKRSRKLGLISRGVRENPEWVNGLLALPLLGAKQPGPLTRESRPEGGMNTRGSWSFTPDTLPGTEFAEGVSPEADSGEFRDCFWSNRSNGRFRENHISTLVQIESMAVT